MRIARVLTRLNLGGPARQVLASDPRLVERGHELRLFVGNSEPGEGDLFDQAVELGLDIVRVPELGRGWSVRRDLSARRFLKRAFTEFQPDVVHTHASKAGALGRAAARHVPRAGRVHTFHGHVLEGYFPRPVARGLAAVERKLARDTDRVVAVSHATADDLVRLEVVDEAKLVVVPPGVELGDCLAIEGRHGALRKLVGADPSTFLVGVLGRLAEIKRPEWALDVFAVLAERFPQLQIVFLGDGDQRRSLERAIGGFSPGQQERLHLIGAIEDVPAALADLDALLLTSRNEGLPVALIEAAAAGLPAVATRVGGVAEIVAEERTGYLGETADELAYGLGQLLEHPQLGPTMGRRARLRVTARHSGEALADRLEALYRAVVEERA